MSVLLRAPRVVTARADLSDAWIAVGDDHRVSAVGSGADLPPTCDSEERVAGALVPAWVDLHAHGALGHDFATCSAEDARAAVAHHRSRGTGSIVASIATGTATDTVAALQRLAPLVEDRTLAGLHLEGPWLSRVRRGAHAVHLLHAPSRDEVRAYLHAGGAALRIVTIAPELPEAIDTIRVLAASGVVVALGHTDADAETFRRGVDAGASLVTHLWNGMPPLHHRRPGPVGVALTDDRLSLECIVDGHHLDRTTVNLVRAAAGSRTVLVSDAMAATGCADGTYSVGGSAVRVADGVALLEDGSSLAGSTITVADAAARMLAGGAPLAEVVAAGSLRPARLLGLPEPLAPGSPANVVVLATGSDLATPAVAA